MKDDTIYLRHILQCIAWLEGYAGGGRQQFMADHKTQAAALRDLQTLGESVKNLSPAITATHAEIDWRGIVGARNVLVHDYMGINLDLVWEMIDHGMPALKKVVQQLLEEAGAPQ